MKRCNCLLAILWSVLTGYSQSAPLKALTIGDTVPDLLLTNLYNYPSSEARLSDFEGKAIILDFWNTGCFNCIKMMPKLDSLEDQFNSQLKVIMVNSLQSDTAARVSKLFNHLEKRFGQATRSTYQLRDSILFKLFPYQWIPQYAWLNKDRRVMAITDAESITGKNVADLINGIELDLPVKDDALIQDGSTTLLDGDREQGYLYRSLITAYQPRLSNSSGLNRDSSGVYSRFYNFNVPLLRLLQWAYYKEFQVEYNRYTFDVKDRTILDQTFCYELIFHTLNLEEAMSIIREDLYRQFHIKVLNGWRTMDCLLLVSNSLARKSKGGEPTADYERSLLKKFFRNTAPSSLIPFLSNWTPLPIVDETGNSASIDIDLPHDIYTYDFSRLRQFLHERGFDLKPAKRKLKVVIIKQSSTK